MAQKLPLRFNILYVLYKAGGAPVSTNSLYDTLKPDYEGEGQFSLNKMEQHLMGIKATGLIDTAGAYMDEGGEARYEYTITDYGRSRIKFLPAAYRD